MHQLSSYASPQPFSIPSQTAMLITTCGSSDTDEFLTFLIYNEFKDVIINVAMETRLSHLLMVVEYTRCPLNIYQCLKKKNERIEHIMTNYFTQLYIPLMEDPSHEADALQYYYEEYDNDDSFDPVYLLFTTCAE
jgi:hypothetical protein